MYLWNNFTKREERVAIIALPVREIKLINKSGRFDFDWELEKEKDIYKIQIEETKLVVGLIALTDIPKELRIEINTIESSKENIGSKKIYDGIAGSLIAFACKLAFMRGYYGFVSLIPKTNLIKHYKEIYGFEQEGKHLYLHLANSEKLIRKYLNQNEKNK